MVKELSNQISENVGKTEEKEFPTKGFVFFIRAHLDFLTTNLRDADAFAA